MDTVSKFRNELDGYRKQLARPYLIDRELNDALLREAHDRSLTEVRASHILVSVAPEAPPEDTLAAWKKIAAIRERVVGGADFASVAKEKGGSDDPSAAKNGGDLGYFTALQMVYPFESAAFATPVGQVSMPVRTRFGYHIIKVVDKRPSCKRFHESRPYHAAQHKVGSRLKWRNGCARSMPDHGWPHHVRRCGAQVQRG